MKTWRQRESTTARLLGEPALRHDQAQAALAAAFSATAMEVPGALLDAAALPLFGVGAAPVREQAQALADQLTNGLCLVAERHDHRALLIDHALTRRCAHPMQIAVIGHELARRAGVESLVGCCEGALWTVIRGGGELALVGPAEAPGRTPASSVAPRCPHQVAAAVLWEIRALAPPAASHRAARLLATLRGRCRRSGS